MRSCRFVSIVFLVIAYALLSELVYSETIEVKETVTLALEGRFIPLSESQHTTVLKPSPNSSMAKTTVLIKEHVEIELPSDSEHTYKRTSSPIVLGVDLLTTTNAEILLEGVNKSGNITINSTSILGFSYDAGEKGQNDHKVSSITSNFNSGLTDLPPGDYTRSMVLVLTVFNEQGISDATITEVKLSQVQFSFSVMYNKESVAHKPPEAPEPSSLALLWLGGIVLFMRRIRLLLWRDSETADGESQC